MQSLIGLPFGIWVAVLTPVLLALVLRVKRAFESEPNGWISLNPSIVSEVLGFSALAMAIGTTEIVILATTSILVDSDAALSLVLGTALAALSWYGVYAFLLVGGRFNSEGFEYRGLLKKVFVPWRDIIKIECSLFWGPYAQTSEGSFQVSLYAIGFQSFLEEAKRHGVEIDEAAIIRAQSADI